jgi:GDPmannose 4,6-dehydratase
MSHKKALITGVTGQDGAFLAEFLLAKGYEVHGIKRRTSLFNTARIDHLFRDVHEGETRFFLHHGDMTDSSSLIHIIEKVRPDEIYNLAAQSHVAVSFEEPEYTVNFDALGVLYDVKSLLPCVHCEFRKRRKYSGSARLSRHMKLHLCPPHATG